MLDLIQTPAVFVDEYNDQSSLWSAVHNPIIFKFQRKDQLIDHIFINPGNEGQGFVVPVSPDVISAEIEAGDLIYISNGTVTGNFEVVANEGTVLIISLGSGYSAGTFPDGFINYLSSRPGYRIEVKIGLVISSVFTPFITTTWVADGSGVIEIDPSEYLRPKLPLVNGFDYESVNAIDTNLGASYTLSLREVWSGHTEDEFSEIEDNYYITNSAKQVGDLYGGNMGEFVTFGFDVDDELKAKFLTGFKEPRYWPAYPYDLAFIYGGLHTHTLIRNTLKLNRNREAFIGGFAQFVIPTNLDSHLFTVNRMTLSDLDLSAAHYINVGLSFDGYGVTESKIIKIENGCVSSPVYLCWKTKNGGWDYWLFGFNQTRKKATGDLSTYEPYLTDFAKQASPYAYSRLKVSSKTSVPSMVIGASAVKKQDIWYNEQYPGLQGLIDSPEVLMLLNPDRWNLFHVVEGPQWMTVVPKVGSLKVLDTRAAVSDIELEITLPYLQIEKQ